MTEQEFANHKERKEREEGNLGKDSPHPQGDCARLPNRLPAEWRVEPPPPSTKAVGDAWVREKRSAVLALPRVIIAGELNYLLNPAHPAFKRIAIGKPERFAFDPVVSG